MWREDWGTEQNGSSGLGGGVGGRGSDGRWKCCQRNVFLEISFVVEIMAVFFHTGTAAITA